MAGKAVFGFNTPFIEQLDFFKRKLNLPTARWDDITRSEHDRAFIVAGAAKADLLDDLNKAVTKVIEQGKGLEEFRKDFAAIVQKHGWHGWTGEGTSGGEAWRTRVIYQTNLATSYAAGRYKQLTDPEFLKLRPYWRYVHNDSVMHPRPLHQEWGDMRLTLPWDHPFWETHFPPNGWGCMCWITPVEAPQDGDATEPPAGWDERNSKGNLPGIDQGFDYAPGASVADEMRGFVQSKVDTLPTPLGKALADDVAMVMRKPSESLASVGILSRDFKTRAQSVYDQIPVQIRQAIKDSGIETVLTDKLITARPDLIGVKPRGWPDGMTWENVEGLFGKERVVIAETYLPVGGKAYVPNDRVEAVLLHEMGHAFDSTGPAQGSLYAQFRKAYATDVDRLAKLGVHVDQYFLQKGRHGPSETFAEIFANIHGYYSSSSTVHGVIIPDDISRQFLACRKVLEDALLPE